MARLLKLLLLKLAKLLNLEIPPIPTVSGMIVEKDKILMIKLSYIKGYALPGGGIEKGESFESALKRELSEEINIADAHLQYFSSSFSHKTNYSTVHVAFLVKTNQKSFTGSSEGEPQWMTFQEAIQKCVYEDEKVLISKYYQEKFDR